MKFRLTIILLSLFLTGCVNDYHGVIEEVGPIVGRTTFWENAGCGVKVRLDDGVEIVAFARKYQCDVLKPGDHVTARYFSEDGAWNIR